MSEPGHPGKPEMPQDRKTNLWEEMVDKNGNSSIQIHELKEISKGCKPDEHYFVFTGGSKREAECKHCRMITTFVLGIHKIVDGKISSM